MRRQSSEPLGSVSAAQQRELGQERELGRVYWAHCPSLTASLDVPDRDNNNSRQALSPAFLRSIVQGTSHTLRCLAGHPVFAFSRPKKGSGALADSESCASLG